MKRSLFDYFNYALDCSRFEVSIYHLKLDPSDCLQAAEELEALARKIRAGVKAYTGETAEGGER